MSLMKRIIIKPMTQKKRTCGMKQPENMSPLLQGQMLGDERIRHWRNHGSCHSA
jgi:hypothetical protein